MPEHILTASGGRFTATWGQAGLRAVDVRAVGEIDVATAPVLARALREAVGGAPLIVLVMGEVTFMDCAGMRVILDATSAARAVASRLVVVHMPAHVQDVFTGTGTLGALDAPAETSVLPVRNGGAPRPGLWRPPANPVNAAVVPARVMAVPSPQLWLQISDGGVQRAWAPVSVSPVALPDSSVELFVDKLGVINGWRDPAGGLAVNQRHLDRAAPPPFGDPVVCRGPCGLLWQAPAARRLVELDERCLSCAGPLAPA